ncbi:hypothetical protein LXA43DRAFT_977602 [Ganoderma leucocontextum]|nr:hypothetical protein LXA43DRAFT_977602 [Ganoderma leucocontextum]
MWALDPIDGMKGFLRSEQYAVCLALLVDTRVEPGVMGCPNLPVSAADPSGPRGCIFVTVCGQALEGARMKLTIATFTPETLNFLESVEKAHTKLRFNQHVGQVLGMTRAPTRMDSQAKYCSLARGMGAWTGYREKIWDYVAGAILIEAAGGVISDRRLGRTLGENYGVIASGKDVHPKVIAAIKQAKLQEGQSQL